MYKISPWCTYSCTLYNLNILHEQDYFLRYLFIYIVQPKFSLCTRPLFYVSIHVHCCNLNKYYMNKIISDVAYTLNSLKILTVVKLYKTRKPHAVLIPCMYIIEPKYIFCVLKISPWCTFLYNVQLKHTYCTISFPDLHIHVQPKHT